MKKYSYKDKSPVVEENVFVADGVRLIGDVRLSQGVNVWFNSVIRADVNQVFIGEYTNIQDLSMLHVTAKHDLYIDKNVSVGHSVVLHGCRVNEGCLIGMGAKILDGAVIGKNSIVASGSVVPPNKSYPEGVMIMGAPAKVVRDLTKEEVESISNHYKSYLNYAKDFMDDSIVKEL